MNILRNFEDPPVRRLPPVTNHNSSKTCFSNQLVCQHTLNPVDRNPNWVNDRHKKAKRPEVRVVMIEEQYPSQNFAANFRGKPMSLDKTVREIIVVKKPGGASNRANGGIGSFRLAFLEIIIGGLTRTNVRRVSPLPPRRGPNSN